LFLFWFDSVPNDSLISCQLAAFSSECSKTWEFTSNSWKLTLEISLFPTKNVGKPTK
jgi:hypothetical protein